jgi:hypothetical protein
MRKAFLDQFISFPNWLESLPLGAFGGFSSGRKSVRVKKVPTAGNWRACLLVNPRPSRYILRFFRKVCSSAFRRLYLQNGTA